MTDEFDLDAEFRDRAVLRSGLRLFRPDDAIDVIRRCRDAGIRVPGEVVQPALDHSIDFSSVRHRSLLLDSWRNAEAFVRERRATPFLFEVVVEGPVMTFPDDLEQS
jgi:hypothetical protein